MASTAMPRPAKLAPLLKYRRAALRNGVLLFARTPGAGGADVWSTVVIGRGSGHKQARSGSQLCIDIAGEQNDLGSGGRTGEADARFGGQFDGATVAECHESSTFSSGNFVIADQWPRVHTRVGERYAIDCKRLGASHRCDGTSSRTGRCQGGDTEAEFQSFEYACNHRLLSRQIYSARLRHAFRS